MADDEVEGPTLTRSRRAYPRDFGKRDLTYLTSQPFASSDTLTHHSFETVRMARGVEGNEMSTPRPSQKKQPPSGSQSAKNQKSILGFFQKKSTASPNSTLSQPTPKKQISTPTLSRQSFTRPPPSFTPVPSSDAPEPPSSPIQREEDTPVVIERNKENGTISGIPTPGMQANCVPSEVVGVALSSPSRKVCIRH